MQEQRERDERERLNREKAEAERKRIETEARRDAAFKAINPPLSEASKYLKPDEYEKFEESISGAIDAFLDDSESYLSDIRTIDYKRWCREIRVRQKVEEELACAKAKAREYNICLNKEIAKLKSMLCPDKKNHRNYFQEEIGDPRYQGQSFASYLTSKEKQGFDGAMADIIEKRLGGIVSCDFRDFIGTKNLRSYFLLPKTEYSLKGVPCLDFMFEVFAVVEIEVWLKPVKKTFGDYVFNLPVLQERGHSTVLEEPKMLGYHYMVLCPEDLGGYVFWQSIPLILVNGVLTGDLKPYGVIISATSHGQITYSIPQFEGEVSIPEDFAGYLGNVGSIDNMVSMGIMSKKIAEIIKEQPEESKEEATCSLSIESRGDTMKAKAFRLFGQSKGPSSPEVKALGLHKSTRFKYYNQFWEIDKSS